MRLQAVLKYLNGVVAVLLLLVLAAAIYWVWRPMPDRSGSIAAPLSAKATATRDELGVPHIRAGSIEDALFLQGYVTAQDRMFQMDAIRRVATGQLSEVLGKRTVELDRESRRLRVGRLAEMHAQTLPAEDRRWMAAYARGVNHYIETHRGKLPLEFTLLRYEPRLWTVADSVAVALHMHRDLTTIWRTELAKAAALAVSKDRDLMQELLPARLGWLMQPGSNAWAISGRHTASGKPLLANDPHLEFNTPSTWYMTHLEAPGLNVTGASLPGVPGIIIGHNSRIAWGITNLQFDVQDLYVEQLDMASGRYLHKGQVLQAQVERDLIRVKGERPVEMQNLVTIHGPVWQATGRQALTLRWTAAEKGTLQFPILDINRAQDWSSFRAALRRFPGPGSNFVYADVDGNIGYQAAALLPVRRSFTGDVPADGASGTQEWDGFVPFEDLPSAFNPPSGMVITGNQDPFPADWKYGVSGDFAPPYRAKQIGDVLRSRRGWKPEDMLTLQKDVYSPYLHFLARVAVSTAGADAEAVRILKGWNGQMEKGLAAPLIVHLLHQQLRIELTRRAAGQALTADAYPSSFTIERLLKTRPAKWYPDWNKVVVQCLAAAMEEGRRIQGRAAEKWDWGQYLTLELKNPIVSQVPWLGRYHGIDRAPMSGAATAVKQMVGRLGPSMRFVADLSDWNRSLNNITLGQSGHVWSKNSDDQWPAYYTGTSFPMRWTGIDGDVLEFRPAQ